MKSYALEIVIVDFLKYNY